MARITRRNFAKLALSIRKGSPQPIRTVNSVLLWTRHPFLADHDEALTVEISEARGAGYRRRSLVLNLTQLVPKAPTPSRSRFGKTQARARLFQDGKSCIEHVVIHARIDRAREGVGDMQKLVADADGMPLARLYADAAAQVD